MQSRSLEISTRDWSAPGWLPANHDRVAAERLEAPRGGVAKVGNRMPPRDQAVSRRGITAHAYLRELAKALALTVVMTLLMSGVTLLHLLLWGGEQARSGGRHAVWGLF